MHIFRIYKNQQSTDLQIKAVKEGYSYAAGIFGILWALYHKMWKYALVTLGITQLIRHIFPENVFLLSQLGLCVFFFFFASEMQDRFYKSKGYDFVDVIYAKSKESAEYKFTKKYYNEA